MDCQFINEKVIAYLEKELSRDDQGKFEGHLAGCRNCQHLVTSIGLTYKLAEKPEGFKISESFVDKTVVRLNRKEARLIPLFYQVLKPIAVAASIGFGILIGNGELTMLEDQLDYNQEETVVLSVTTPTDYSVWQTLEEGYGSEE